MAQATFWPLPQTEIDESYKLQAHWAYCEARDVGVNVSKDSGGPGRIEGTPFGVNGVWYRQGEISVASTYFSSPVAYRQQMLNGDLGEWTGCPYIFAIPLDPLTSQYACECQRWLGTLPTQANLDQFIKDIVDALRLYADTWLRYLTADDGSQLQATVLGFKLEPARCNWEVTTELVAKGLSEAHERNGIRKGRPNWPRITD